MTTYYRSTSPDLLSINDVLTMPGLSVDDHSSFDIASMPSTAHVCSICRTRQVKAFFGWFFSLPSGDAFEPYTEQVQEQENRLAITDDEWAVENRKRQDEDEANWAIAA